MVFLFTDLVDSTGMKERLGDRDYVRLVLQPHNTIFRELLGRFPGGQERDNAGDGFFVTFGSLADAVRFALLLQHRLQTAAWEAERPATRIGIHLGDATEFEDSGSSHTKTAGQAVDLAARVMGLAAGNQILLTRAAFDSARQYVHAHPAAATGEGALELQWLAHGRYLFKGKDEPMEVFEVGAIGHAPLRAPPDSEKARRVVSHEEESTLGWRPGAGRAIPRRPGWSLVSQLGEGGFGEVWLAHHDRTKEERVFKFCFDPERLRSFKRELTLFRLIRDNLGDRHDIARLLEVQVDEPPFYLESEYAPAGNLSQWAERRGGLATLSLDARLDLLAKIARAVAAAHSLGIIHKDIKPSNVLIAEDGSRICPRLTDFGIGVLVNPSLLAKHGITESGFTQSLANPNDSSRTGTRLYLPPESQVGKPATTAGDVYALGVMLYQFVTGDLLAPLGLGWEEDVADDLLREDILLCTHRDPQRRLPCAGDLADRLEQLDQRRVAREAARAGEEERIAVKRRAEQQSLKVHALRGILVAASVALVILCGLLFVSHKGYLRAIQHAEDGYGEWALQNNEFAAKLAAQRVTEELGRCFELVRDEAERPELFSFFKKVVTSGSSLARLEDPSTPENELDSIRVALRSESDQKNLERYLQTRLAAFERVSQTDPRALKLASIFVTNTRGTQVAAAVFDDSVTRSTGRNYAHRPYFHGGPEMLPPIARTITNPPHIQQAHLSAAYYSTAQQAWKVAISTPVVDEHEAFAGVLAFTIDLGDFHLASEAGGGQKQSVVLVDARSGNECGTILHHPLFKKLLASGRPIPNELLGEAYHVPASLLAGEAMLHYCDPLGKYPGDDGLAQEFKGRLLAASSPVLPPIGASRESDSGLVVLVQSDYDSVVAPTRQLGEQFARSSVWMLVVVTIAGFSMLYIVSGTLRELAPRLQADQDTRISPRS
jgi:serine/threonine protein kinase/class 3 adenylate cyclase